MKRIPILPTLLVLVAVGYMIHLGLWQLQRLDEKQAMLARYEGASGSSDLRIFPDANPAHIEDALYHRSQVDCRFTSGDWESISGRNDKGDAGYVHVILCGIQANGTAYVQAGWSRDPKPPVWNGGVVNGIVAPFHKDGAARLIADPPLAGLQANAKPDPRDIPNNHLAYAVQWFLFAGVALVIYALALRKRMRAG
ncbi:SURF1 family protein [Novosphingobium sp. PASSN1]|uniref:SURF1 family protein n=1 Tax=Novosphingobium sp. PASSN1 TaxID=2015561 RepID=UPI000BDB2339|nr:SURF1 family protein [Novosphingobium sp. PASSN1]OYU35052.1 MAG: threonine synthase [Novosphingobium sp. PASSN1]